VADLYDTDIVRWSDQQAELLRRLAAGERVNDAVDWPNVIEEIESVGNEEHKAVASALMRGIQHKLYVLCWPRALAVQHWQAEIRIHLAEAGEDFRESMRKDIEPALPRLYRRASRWSGTCWTRERHRYLCRLSAHGPWTNCSPRATPHCATGRQHERTHRHD
jgi:hypothetical protein